MELSSITPSVAGLRALSHPMRLRLLGLLRLDGPSTASALATRLDLNSGATSYHLRQLAQHGFIVEDTGRGNGRERWWRAAHQTTVSRSADLTSEEEREAHDAFLQAAAVTYTQNLQAAIEERGMLSEEWRHASTFSDWEIRLTPARAREVTTRIRELLAEVEEDPEGTEGAELFAVQLNAYPFPGRLAPRES